MVKPLLFALILAGSVCAKPTVAVANETTYASLNQVDATYSLYKGATVRVQASGTVNDVYDVLQLKEFNVFLDGRRIDDKKFNQIKALRGVKLGTLQVTSESWYESATAAPTVRFYLNFDCHSEAHGPLKPSSREDREHVRIEFDQTGIKKITKTALVAKEVPLK